MFIISFNINNKNSILTRNPIILSNKEIRPIIEEIRNIIKKDFISNNVNISLIDLELGISTLMLNNNYTTMHQFNIKLKNIKKNVKKNKNR